MLPYNKNLTHNVQELRKNMTPEERHLWYDFLKKLPLTVKRQKNIENYIVDFYIPCAKIAIELDGIQHGALRNIAEDRKRDRALAKWGITVLRYPNEMVKKQFSVICADIQKHITATEISLSNASSVSRCEPPSPTGEG